MDFRRFVTTLPDRADAHGVTFGGTGSDRAEEAGDDIARCEQIKSYNARLA